MKLLAITVILSAGTVIITACSRPTFLKSMAPFVSGSVVERTRDGSHEFNLSPAQLDLIHTWLASHPSGWSYSPASYVPSTEISVQHRDGNSSKINVFPSGFVVLNSHSSQFVRQSTQAEISVLFSALK
jgi:hypothetical protein